MIAPIAKYTIKGALWYQGESEAGRGLGHVYGEALETLVGDWRRAFGQGNFPFFYVQLANFGNAAKNGHWMRVQEGQVKAAGLKKTGVGFFARFLVELTSALGDVNCLHIVQNQGKRTTIEAASW